MDSLLALFSWKLPTFFSGRLHNSTNATVDLSSNKNAYSSRMRTTRLLTASQLALLGVYLSRRCTCPEGGTSPRGVPTRGVYLPGGVPARVYLPRGYLPSGVYLLGGCTCLVGSGGGEGCRTCPGGYLPR